MNWRSPYMTLRQRGKKLQSIKQQRMRNPNLKQPLSRKCNIVYVLFIYSLNELKSFAKVEAQIQEAVIKKLSDEKVVDKKIIKELATTLKVPRLHLGYIRQNGAD